ncbi:MAG: 50S ribosomal protein L22 [Candidatus Micrarchaeota archaeon]|nr:50S ribosomal protein L22 [Candidatus Micrarchaeota archaeon]
MVHYEYGFAKKSQYNEKELAKAQLYNIDASYKDLAAVCDNIRGLTADEGVNYLNAVLNGFPVLYRRWNKKLGHRKELGGRKGRYPVKAAKIVLGVLNNAIANATAKGLDQLVIVHAAANKQSIYPRMQSKGRQIRSDYETARVEIILAGKENEELIKQQKQKIEQRAKVKAEAKELQKSVEETVEEKTKEVIKETTEKEQKSDEKKDKIQEGEKKSTKKKSKSDSN